MNVKKFKKLLEDALLSETPSQKIDILRKTDDGKILLSCLNDIDGLEQNKYHKHDVLNHTYLVLDNSPKKLNIRYAALFHDVGKPKTKTNNNGKIQFINHEEESEIIVDNVLTQLNYSKTFIDNVKKLVVNHMLLKYIGDEANIPDKKLFNFKKIHNDYMDDLLDLIHADNISHGTEHDMKNQIPILKKRLINLNYNPVIKKELPLNGNDIIKYFNVSGKMVGFYLNKLEDYYNLNPNLNKDEYVNYLKQIKIDEKILSFDSFINLK